MNASFLSNLSINYVDELGFEDLGFTFWMRVATTSEMLNIRFKGLVYLNFSRDYLDVGPQEISVYEIDYDYRNVVSSDLDKYAYRIENTGNLPMLHFVTFEATSIISIACRDISSESLWAMNYD